MAGLGEASAILSVAQVGISLSFTLVSFIGDVKDARKRIKIVADEISLTAQRLKELGDLIEKNDRTKFFGEDSLKSTFTLAKGCEVALTEIRLVLKKASVTVDPTEAKKDEIEIGSFSNWLWPWTKVQLAPPRADLATLKDDLQLLYLSVMANNASTAAERSKYAQSIPGFYRSRQSAAAERDRALQRRSESSKQRPSRHSGEGNPGTFSDEEDLLQQELHNFREKQLAEENERRIREQAELLKLEDEKKAREEEQKVKEIEHRAVEEWKVKTAEEEEKRQKKLEESRDLLKRRLLQEHLSNDQIESILGILTIEDPLSVETSSGKEGSPKSNHNKAQTIPRIVERVPPKPESRLSRIFSYLGKGSPRSSRYTSSSSSFASSYTPSVRDLRPDLKIEKRFEAWALKQDPHQQTRVPLPGKWIEQHATKKICPSKSLLKRFSFLHPYYKTQINKLIEEKNAEETSHGWFLVSLQAVKKVLRENLFRRHEVEICVLIVLVRLCTEYAYSGTVSDTSSVSSTTRERRGPLPGLSPNAMRAKLWPEPDPPAPSSGLSSAPPHPPPGTSFPFQLLGPLPPPPSGPSSAPPPPPLAGTEQKALIVRPQERERTGEREVEREVRIYLPGEGKGPVKRESKGDEFNYGPIERGRSPNVNYKNDEHIIRRSELERPRGPASEAAELDMRRRKRERPKAAASGKESFYRDSIFPTRKQSPSGSYERLRSNNTGHDEWKPHVSFTTHEHESGSHSRIRRMPYGSASTAEWSGSTSSLADDTRRTGIRERISSEDMRTRRRSASASDSSSTSDDDYGPVTFAVENSNRVVLRKNTDKNRDADQPTNEADEEIIKRYLTRYTSMHEVAGNAPSDADADPGLTHVEIVAEPPNITGQVVESPRTSVQELPTRPAGTEDLENIVIRPIDPSHTIPSGVMVPYRGSVSSSVIERSSHEGSTPQLSPKTFIFT